MRNVRDLRKLYTILWPIVEFKGGFIAFVDAPRSTVSLARSPLYAYNAPVYDVFIRVACGAYSSRDATHARVPHKLTITAAAAGDNRSSRAIPSSTRVARASFLHAYTARHTERI